jgi:hypothetical protein
MSDTPVDVSNVSPPAAGVSDVLNASLDAGAAAQHMQQLKNDPDFMKRVTAGNAEAFSQYNRLWRISRGMSPGAGAATVPGRNRRRSRWANHRGHTAARRLLSGPWLHRATTDRDRGRAADHNGRAPLADAIQHEEEFSLSWPVGVAAILKRYAR